MTTLTIKYQNHDPVDALRLIARNTWKRIDLYVERSHQRRQLAQFSTEQLRDMGISRDAALAESARSFWQS